MILNKAERERPTMERIRRWFEEGSVLNRALIIDYHEPDLFARLLEFSPNVVLTFPFTAAPVSQPFVLLKKLLGCHVVCLRAEGVVDFSSEQHIRWFAGMDSYPSTLVDYELAWGSRSADVLKDVLVRQGKITDASRVRCFGHPGLEPHFEALYDPDAAIPAALQARFAGIDRKKVILFITGFHLAEYSREDLINAGDIVQRDDPDYERRLDEACAGAERARRFRSAWVEAVLRCAEKNPDALFVVKAHPIEKIFHIEHGRPNPYAALLGVPNIVHLYENIPVASLLAHSGVFLHYGSTCAVEPYLLGVPSVFVTSREIYGDPSAANSFDYSNLGWPSRWNADLNELPDLIARHMATPLEAMKGSSPMESLMNELFSVGRPHVEGREPYLPSRDIADFLKGLESELPQEIAEDDPYLRSSLEAWGSRFVGFCAARIDGKSLHSRAALIKIARLARIAGTQVDWIDEALAADLAGLLARISSPRARDLLNPVLSQFSGRHEEIARSASALVQLDEHGAVEIIRTILSIEDPQSAVLLDAHCAPEASSNGIVAERRCTVMARRQNRHPPLALDRVMDRVHRLVTCGEFAASLDMLFQLADDEPERAREACLKALAIVDGSGLPPARLARERFFEFRIEDRAKVLELWTETSEFPFATVHSSRGGGGDESRLPYANGEFELVFCGGGILACPDPIACCKELRRVARMGYVEVPGRRNLQMVEGARWSLSVEDGVLVFDELDHPLVVTPAWSALVRASTASSVATSEERIIGFFQLFQCEPWMVRHSWTDNLAVRVRRRSGSIMIWKET